MQVQHLPPGGLYPNPFNSNVVSAENMEKIKASLVKHGWVRPIIARSTDDGVEILGGQHRCEAAIELGHETVPVIVLSGVDDTQAREIGLIDNARYGVDDAVALAEIMADIGGVENVMDILPISTEEIAALSTTVSDDDIDDLLGEEPEEKKEAPVEKPRKSHQMMRFKVPVDDADTTSDALREIMQEQGFTEADALTNAGDALVFLIGHWKETQE